MSEPDGTCAVGGPAESCLGWHESYSSPEFYYCRPLMQGEAMGDLGVDAITCPSRFNSEKGKFDPDARLVLPATQRHHQLHLARHVGRADLCIDQ